jgi:hypothetical protein
MANILQNSRPIRSTLLGVMLAFAPAWLMYPQATPANPSPADQQPQASPNAQQPDQSIKPAAEAEPSTPATLEEVRQAQIDADTKLLYQLSAELRAEVAKTYKESLSVTVLKKAQELEKLAKKLKAEMHLEVAAAKH